MLYRWVTNLALFMRILLIENVLLIWGSIRCALATKIGGEAKAHEISNNQKGFGQILNSLEDIKIMNIFNGVPKAKLRENKN